MMLHDAFEKIRCFAERAYVTDMPEVHLIFKNQGDQNRFLIRVIGDLKPADVAADPAVTRSNLQFAGIKVNLFTREMSLRAAAERTIAKARSIHRYADTSSKLTEEDTTSLKDALGRLLALIGE
jgi:hypothetical protein